MQFKDCIAYLDLHNLGGGTYTQYYSLYQSVLASNDPVYNTVLQYLVKKNVPSGGAIQHETNENPCTFNYSQRVLGIPSGNPEWADSKFSGSTYSAEDMTKAVEWYGNIILEHCRLKEPESFIRELNYTRASTNLNLNVGSIAEIQEFHFSFDAPGDGIVLVEGIINIKGTDAAAQHFITPVLSQVGTDFSSFTPSSTRDEVYAEGDKRMPVPFQTQKYVKRTQPGVGAVVFGVFGYTTAGTTTIYRLRCRITFIPSNGDKRYAIYSASGREGQGLNAMQSTYQMP
ncbi:hypothetical protein FJ05194_4144 [Mycobacterium tuberculosis FJ05194]|nr:hypothetical protein FJ05194_4144 [Mycobacterium tuberculosis FJ05194]